LIIRQACFASAKILQDVRSVGRRASAKIFEAHTYVRCVDESYYRYGTPVCRRDVYNDSRACVDESKFTNRHRRRSCGDKDTKKKKDRTYRT